MLEASIENLKKIAADSSTPSHLLIELGKHENFQIRSLVAGNPNTPLDTLKSFGTEFADAIVKNPAFNLLKLEDSNNKFIQLTIARSTQTSPEELVKLISLANSDLKICQAVVNNINTPINALENLLISVVDGTTGYIPSFPTGRLIVDWTCLAVDIIQNPKISESCLEKALDIAIESNYEGLIREYTSVPKPSFKILEKLATYPQKHPDKEPVGCSDILIDFPIVQKSPILIDKIARNTPYSGVFLKIATNPATSTKTSKYLAAHPHPEVRSAVRKHPNVSRKVLEILSFMEGKPGIPVETLMEIAENPRFKVLKNLCTYPNVNSEILDKVGDNLPRKEIHGAYRWDVINCLAYHPNSSLGLLRKITSELEEVSSFVSNGGQSWDYEIHINKDFLQKTNKLIEKIYRRLKGEHLSETDKFFDLVEIATKSMPVEDIIPL